MFKKFLKAVPVALAMFFGASQAMAELHPPHYFLFNTFEVLVDTKVQGIDNKAEKHSFPHHTHVAVTPSTRWDFLSSSWIRYPNGRVYQVPVHYYLSTGANTVFPSAPAPAPQVIYVPGPTPAPEVIYVEKEAPIDCTDPNSPEYSKMNYETKYIGPDGSVEWGYSKGFCATDKYGNPCTQTKSIAAVIFDFVIAAA